MNRIHCVGDRDHGVRLYLDALSAALSTLTQQMKAGFDHGESSDRRKSMIACRVKWEGPLTLEAVLQMQDADDFGLYQIYGRHVVFGPASLLYIGRTEQSFGERFQSHCDSWLWDDQYPSDDSARSGVSRCV